MKLTKKEYETLKTIEAVTLLEFNPYSEEDQEVLFTAYDILMRVLKETENSGCPYQED